MPTGDILRAILAMSPYDYPVLKSIFYKNRFSVPGKLYKHDLGNIFLVLAEKYSGNYLQALQFLEEAVEAVGHVYPATLDKVDLVAELENGQIIFGENKIDEPEYDRKLRIRKVWLEPEAKIFKESKKAIENADYIFFGPGSLYTSIIATVLPSGFQSAFKKSQAKLVYVMGNAYEKAGETGPEMMSEFVRELQNYLPRKIDTVIYSNHKLTKLEKSNYKKRGWQLFGVDPESLPDYKIIAGDYERWGGGLCPDRLSEVLKNKILK